jgi:hypothetical protein
MKILSHDTVFCPFCGNEVLLDSKPCHHVQYVYGWSSVDPNGYIYTNPNFFQTTLKTLLPERSYNSLFSRLSATHIESFLPGHFIPMDALAREARYCGDKADVTFSVIHGAGYSGYYVGFSEAK